MSRLVSLFLPDDPESGRFRSERGLDRLAGFSDGVVAISITLVALPLIELTGEQGTSMGKLLTQDGYRFAAAAVSFVVIAAAWREHHAAFERATVDSRRLVSLDLIWLAAIVALPIPTAVLLSGASPAEQRLDVALYAAVAAVASITMRLMEWEIRRHCSPAGTIVVSRWGLATQWVSPALLVLISVLALTGLGARALVVLVLALPLQQISLLSARRRRAAGGRSADA